MNWKVFITACVSAFLISFPQNIIGCGPDADPYDYYTSFFHQNLPDAKAYRPFYYTGYNFLYDASEPVNTPDILAQEWAGYCTAPVSAADAKKLVNKFSVKDLHNLYYHIEKGQPLKIPDSVKQNSMTEYFLNSKDLEALGYILYARQAEPYVIGGADDWIVPERDSLKMAKLIKNGQQLYGAAKKDIFKQKYAYQFLRLAHYSGRYTDVINWYDEYAAQTNTNSILKPLCLSLKAGALFRSGRQKEAAYLFSKVFASTPVKRVSNYLGFKWSVDSKTERKEYVDLCKNNEERASMLALFALGSVNNELSTMEEIFRLNPASEELEVLVVREINKLEEKYFSPVLQKQSGGKAFYFNWTDGDADSIVTDAGKEVKALATFLHNAAQNNKLKNAGLLETAAAYAAYMMKDYSNAREYAAVAATMPLTPKLKDQWALTNLLITLNEKEKIDAAFEELLLPSLQWLEERMRSEKPVEINYSEIQQWKTIYRNLMSEILAKRYHEQGDLVKEALCIGAADWIMKGKQNDYRRIEGVEFLRNKLISKDVEKLYAMLDNKQPTRFDHYLFIHNSVTKKEVVDFAGTCYLREYNYSKAMEWFKKSQDKNLVAKNPFVDLLYDREEPLRGEKNYKTTKLAFAQEMLRLQKAAETDKANAAKHYYKMALGMYNMTYYGHTWELVQYGRSGVDGYYIPQNTTGFQKEYYGCYKAHDYFEKAMKAANDRNFKARCLFMMAKCSQKQVHQPQYNEYTGNWDKYDAAFKDYWPAFTNNKYFPPFVKEYGNTAFYQEAFSSCSYLRDFVKRK
ncbi:MAG: hypothetical protein KTQ13_01190 [Ferruginibacter sp.]|nr:hypothetical protein [Ferruginibacter sp.]MBU9935237.1 hypothetical protein [Ferruginibacter sp.]